MIIKYNWKISNKNYSKPLSNQKDQINNLMS